MIAVAPGCPSCGKALAAVALDPDTAPWLCADCSRGYWQTELDAAAHFDPLTRSFGDVSVTVVAAAYDERGGARVRGTSARPDTLPLLPDDVLAGLAKRRGVAAGFVTQVAAEQARRKSKGA